MDVEIMSWSVTVSTKVKRAVTARELPRKTAKPSANRRVFEPTLAKWRVVPVYERTALAGGARIAGPALIVEDQTTVFVTANFDAAINSAGHIVLDKRRSA
jgi:N-methylhydantoinase A